MARIQLITIIVNFLFIAYIARLIIKGRLREEYAIVWIVCTIILTVFSFWRNGLEIMAKLVGVYEAPNLVFTGAIFAILIYLLHISVVVSKLQNNIRKLTQEIALLKESIEEKKEDKNSSAQ